MPQLYSLILIFFLLTISATATATATTILRLPSDNSPEEICPITTRPGSCPVNCFRPDPVCGDNGVTYWCGCPDAHCSGTRVAKLGFCEAIDLLRTIEADESAFRDIKILPNVFAYALINHAKRPLVEISHIQGTYVEHTLLRRLLMRFTAKCVIAMYVIDLLPARNGLEGAVILP